MASQPYGWGLIGASTIAAEHMIGAIRSQPGHDVVCVDVDAAKVDGLERGVVPIYEPGLEPMVKANHASGRLRFTTDAASAVAHGEIIFIAHPDQPRDLVRQLKAFLEERTPYEWSIRATNESVTPVESLSERRKREEAKALEELKRQPFVAEALKHFPGAEIAKVTNPVDENGADVVPMPQQTSAPSPARKKEAEK